MGHPERKFHLPTTNFQGRAVGFREGKLNNTQPIQPPTYEWNKSLPLVAVSLWFHFDDQSSPVDFFFGGEGAFEAWNLRVWSCQIDVVFSPEKRALFQWKFVSAWFLGGWSDVRKSDRFKHFFGRNLTNAEPMEKSYVYAENVSYTHKNCCLTYLQRTKNQGLKIHGPKQSSCLS